MSSLQHMADTVIDLNIIFFVCMMIAVWAIMRLTD
jgi:hypothetical protein